MEIRLGEIANIQFGYYGQPSKDGTIPYLQAKNYDEFGQYEGENATFLNEDSRSNANLLDNDDILFVAKGFRFFATIYKKEFGNAIASSIFYILRVDKSKIIPEYLVSVLNLPKNIMFFQHSASGSSIPSIRKNELVDFTFNLIPLAEQAKVVEIQKLYLHDIEITKHIIKEKQKLFQTTISTIIN